MKRVCCLIFVLFVIVAAFPVISAAEGGYLWMVDSSDGVNVRDAKKGGEIIKTLRKGEIIQVCSEDKFWVGFRLENGKIGYCYKEYLHIAHAEEIEAWENRKKNGITLTNEDAFAIGIINDECKVYKRANGKVIGFLDAGDEVYIRQTGKYWYKIVWQDSELAFVQAKYIDFYRPNIPTEGEYKKVSCNGYASIYEEPDSKSEKVGKVKNGHYVVILDDSDEKYAYVCFDSECNDGYILKKYLKEF